MFVIAVGHVAPGRDLLDVHLADVGGHATKVDILQVLPLRAKVGRPPHFHAHSLGKLQIVA